MCHLCYLSSLSTSRVVFLKFLCNLKLKLKIVIDPPGGGDGGVLLGDQVDKATTLGGVQWDG